MRLHVVVLILLAMLAVPAICQSDNVKKKWMALMEVAKDSHQQDRAYESFTKSLHDAPQQPRQQQSQPPPKDTS
uniref:Uncharacterized protein n=1 Tax=Globodera rostochiensis TaxID=31243 RepID=A0A914I200_GLORO